MPATGSFCTAAHLSCWEPLTRMGRCSAPPRLPEPHHKLNQTSFERTPSSPASERFILPELQPNEKTQERQVSQGLITEKSIGRDIPDLILKEWQVYCSSKGQGLPEGVISCLRCGYQRIYLCASAAEMAPLRGFLTVLLFNIGFVVSFF